MSRPNIQFVYTGEFRSPVHQLQRGPAKLEKFYESVLHPEYEDIRDKNDLSQINQAPVISKVELDSKPTSPPMIRYKSSENIKDKIDGNPILAPVLNIEEVEQSEMKMINKDSKKGSSAQNDQVVLKAPSYRIEPRKEGDIAVHSRRQFKKQASVEKTLNSQANNLKSRKQLKNTLTQKEMQLRSEHPLLKIEEVRQNDFKTENVKVFDLKKGNSEGQKIVLKAPKYKYSPREEGATTNRKKEYTKLDNAEKYMYNSIPNQQEGNFISCFGCIKPQAKVYQAED